ncbi:MAG: hypothetical protein NC301_05210 [Bacteroides sp.]|nr:hypothetical protein [Bacteroides sp.]MCM1379835.1 hypothetical protein [Bacteroides sp.]MCM1446194.1 hypothetical protein [Prevotella sp.]
MMKQLVKPAYEVHTAAQERQEDAPTMPKQSLRTIDDYYREMRETASQHFRS